MLIGYARVSTHDQELTLQLDALKAAGCGKVYSEKRSGATTQRPEFQRMLDQIRNGDVVVVWKLDRLARSTLDLLKTVQEITAAGGAFRSLSEPWLDTASPAGRMILTVFAGLAEFERELIRERTGAGRKAAKENGVKFGRKRKLNGDQVRLARELLTQGKGAREVGRMFDVHGATIRRLGPPNGN